MVLDLPNGMTFDLTREQFARDWALGQFTFHVIAAYAILRKQGVAIGKADYVPHMFGYLRAQTEALAGASTITPRSLSGGQASSAMAAILSTSRMR